MKSFSKKDTKDLFMNRKETSLWLGRAMSTGEVSIQTLLKLAGILAFQQKVLQALVDQQPPTRPGVGESDALAEMRKGATEEILKSLSEIDEQLKPIAKAVDQACAQLEKDIR
jgi:hypothetical protein